MIKRNSIRKQRRELHRRQRRIERRLARRTVEDQPKPAMTGRNMQYEIAKRERGLAVAGIGAMHRMVVRLGLVDAINNSVFLLRKHLPYWESDHVLANAYNILSGGTCIEDLELRRQDEAFLDALGAERIPDPTTSGDFCRRFAAPHIDLLMDAINETRLRVWSRQPASFFDEAVIDADGTTAPTTGECKEGMDVTYKGEWGYHPLIVSLANTAEPLFLVNRPGNRPSHEGAAPRFDQAIALCRRAGFRRILLRGDTDFSQTAHLDRWDEDGVKFIFGYDAAPGLKARAGNLPESSWSELHRPPRYEVETEPRARPANIRDQIVRERGYKNIRLNSEWVAEFDYSPNACGRTYRMVVVRKNITVERGETALFDEVRYRFYIANEREVTKYEVVHLANARCDQENLISNLKTGVCALKMPTGSLESNWAYMVMAALAWSLKAWFALLLPESGPWSAKHATEKATVLRMEFKAFLNHFIRMPCQLVLTGRRIVYRLLAWNPWLHVFLRGVQAIG